jgi:hypothetical protein
MEGPSRGADRDSCFEVGAVGSMQRDVDRAGRSAAKEVLAP